MIHYQLEPELDVEAYIDVLERSTLALRRPVDDRDRMIGMLKHADLIVTARENDQLVGLARSITDFTYCTYLADLAVDQAYQKRGIGTELLKQTHRHAGLETQLLLLSAPKAVGYYERIGLTLHPACFLYDAKTKLR